MCIATAGLIAGAAGTAIQTLGSIGSGNAAAAQSRYQAQVAANNAIIAERNANYAVAAGEAKATDQGMKGRATVGATRAALAAQGLDVNTGSAADVRQGVAQTGQLNTERVRQDASLRAYGYRTQATNFEAESRLQRRAAKNDTTAGYLRGAGTLLAGGATLGGKWDALRVDPLQAASGSPFDLSNTET